MPIKEIMNFRDKYKSLIKWTKYMSEKMEKIEIEKFREKWIPKFLKDVCEPFDIAWETLTNEERETFFPEDTSIDAFKESALDKRIAAKHAILPDAPF